MITRGGDVDRGICGSSRGNQLEIGKALDDFAGQRGPLAHDTNDIKRQQPLNHGIRIGEVVLKHGDVSSITQHRPIGALKRRILVIVQNSDLAFLHGYPSRAALLLLFLAAVAGRLSEMNQPPSAVSRVWSN